MANYYEYKSLIKSLYKDRENYTIIALTGYSGTGCSRLAEMMSKKFSAWTDIRKPEDLIIKHQEILDNEELMYQGLTNHQTIGTTIFARKYTLCHNFLSHHYEPFRILKYSHALLFYSLDYLVNKMKYNEEKPEEKKEKILNHLNSILKDKFRPSREKKDDNYREKRFEGIETSDPDQKLPEEFSYASEEYTEYAWMKAHNLDNFKFKDWDELIQAFERLDSKNNATKAALFFGEEGNDVFIKFVESLNNDLWKIDPYCTNFFYHRLGFTIRATGDPTTVAHDVIHSDKIYGKNIYCIVELINHLVKGYRKIIDTEYDQKVKEIWEKKQKEKGIDEVGNEEKGIEEMEKEIDEDIPRRYCRIVIDKIRNSLEAKFLKERYSAFYLIATHEEKEVKNHLKDRIEKNYESEDEMKPHVGLIELQKNKILSLDAVEREGKDFENGKFFAQNISQCVADAEIHISNEDGQGGTNSYFYSMSEQWMKYAALIQHPGLITPSSEERCMVVAYTAKFNSGCISRQVGAVITNKAHTIRTIGWNDVPYGQVPCSLRELPVMATGKWDTLKISKYLYSDYETGDVKPFKDGETFNEKVKIKYRNLHLGIPDRRLMNGMPYPYCFKALQNEFEGEKNQVHIRSLHAEENAILQMAKYGGEALHEGIIYVTASPCELCCKKLYQIGVRKIVYIDEYPGISRQNIIASGVHRPRLKQFQGAYGATYFKLYQPFIPYKEELNIRLEQLNCKKSYKKENLEIINDLFEKEGLDLRTSEYSEKELREKLHDIKWKQKSSGKKNNAIEND